MKLQYLTIKNYRNILNTRICVYDINSITGNHGSGKTNILRALDVFFNDAPITDYDLCVDAKSTQIQLTASFSKEDKDEVLWDTLSRECLLNDKLLSITKTYEKVDGKWKSTTAIFAPQCPCFNTHDRNNVPLISLEITELKDICNKYKIKCINNKEGVALRSGIMYGLKGILQYKEVLVPVDAPYTDLKTIYSSIKSAMPGYVFFGCDNMSFSDDREINSLINGLVQIVNKEAKAEFDAYKLKVKSAIKEKLKNLWEEYVPQDMKEQHDINVAIDINPSLFKYTLVNQDNIPLNLFGNEFKKRLLLAFLEMYIKNNPNMIVGIDELDSYIDSYGLNEFFKKLGQYNSNCLLFAVIQNKTNISYTSSVIQNKTHISYNSYIIDTDCFQKQTL